MSAVLKKSTEQVLSFFTQVTGKSPCLHETLATAAITMRNARSVSLMAAGRGFHTVVSC